MKTFKFICVFACCLCYSLSISAQALFNLEDNFSKLSPDKRIASITVLKYSSGNTGDYNKEVKFYDDEGKQLREVIYKNNSTAVLSEVVYRYDDNERLLVISNVAGGKERVTTAFNYMDDGQVVEKKEFMYINTSMEPLTYVSRYEYLKDTLLGKLKISAPKHTVVYSCSYNADNQKIGELYTDAEGNVLYRVELVYDNSGNIIRKVRYNGDDKVEQETMCQYNQKGELLVSIEYNHKGEEMKRREFTYYNGLMTGYKIISHDKVVSVITKKYDNNGNLVYDSQKREYYIYNDKNLMIEKGRIEAKNRIPMEQYSYAFFEN